VAFAAQQTPIEHGVVQSSEALMNAISGRQKYILQTHSLKLSLPLRDCLGRNLYEKVCMALNQFCQDCCYLTFLVPEDYWWVLLIILLETSLDFIVFLDTPTHDAKPKNKLIKSIMTTIGRFGIILTTMEGLLLF
jgi:hypothetical protein